MGKYIVISGAPTTRELRSDPAPASRWRIIHPHDHASTSIESHSESISYGLPPEEGPSTMMWPNSQSQSQSQSQTQSQIPTQPETYQANTGDSITSTSTASTVLELEQHMFIRTFPTNTLSQSQSLATDSSSVINFPTFHFSLRSLTPLRVTLTPAGRGSIRATLLVAVLDVDGPDPITTKTGQETHLLRLVVGEDDGSVGKLTAWGDTALEWGGAKKMPGLRRGDVVLLSDVQVTSAPPEVPTLSASPRYGSGVQLCYRTVQRTDEDKYLRPDLRLGQADACVRRVAVFVEWVQRAV